MRKLGEQWIEVIDGQEHMVKEVSALSYGDCNGCFLFTVAGCGKVTDFAPCSSDTIIKDLGILKDGLLPEERTGKYPIYVVEKRFGEHMDEEKHWHKFYVFSNGTNVEAGGWTLKEAIDAWNRRT